MDYHPAKDDAVIQQHLGGLRFFLTDEQIAADDRVFDVNDRAVLQVESIYPQDLVTYLQSVGVGTILTVDPHRFAVDKLEGDGGWGRSSTGD